MVAIPSAYDSVVPTLVIPKTSWGQLWAPYKTLSLSDTKYACHRK